jgi:type II secretory pathway predicted ATPase ExeA
MKWLTHFGLREAPFSKEIGDADLWVPSSRKHVASELVEAVAERGHVLLTGEPGVGKTCVLRAVRRQLPESGYRLTYCHNATLGRRDFYRHVCLALGLSPKATAAAVFWAISAHIEELGGERVHPVFLLDEAHLLHQDVLEHLHILANYEWDSRALLSLVLVGLPETRARLALSKNRSLYSRIHTRIALGESSPDDTAEYLAYRLRRAGAERDLVAPDAAGVIHEASRGRLRDIDRIGTACLKLAARKKARVVERDIVARVVRDDGSDELHHLD